MLRYFAPNVIGQLARTKAANVIIRTTSSSTTPSPPAPSGLKSTALTKTTESETQVATTTPALEIQPTPRGPINVTVRWRDPGDIRRVEEMYDLEPLELEPVFVPEPVRQEWIARIPVEYHGTLPDKFNNDTIWLPIYRLPYLSRFILAIKAKIYLTVLSLTACGIKVTDLLSGNMSFSGNQVLLLSAATLGGLVYMGDYFRRLTCQIYVTEDLQYIRFCRFTFFGRRRDLVLPKELVIPLPELNPSYRKSIFQIRFSLPENIDLEHDEIEFYDKGLKLFIKFGGVLDRERFRMAMGNVFIRLAE